MRIFPEKSCISVSKVGKEDNRRMQCTTSKLCKALPAAPLSQSNIVSRTTEKFSPDAGKFIKMSFLKPFEGL